MSLIQGAIQLTAAAMYLVFPVLGGFIVWRIVAGTGAGDLSENRKIAASLWAVLSFILVFAIQQPLIAYALFVAPS